MNIPFFPFFQEDTELTKIIAPPGNSTDYDVMETSSTSTQLQRTEGECSAKRCENESSSSTKCYENDSSSSTKCYENDSSSSIKLSDILGNVSQQGNTNSDKMETSNNSYSINTTPARNLEELLTRINKYAIEREESNVQIPIALYLCHTRDITGVIRYFPLQQYVSANGYLLIGRYGAPELITDIVHIVNSDDVCAFSNLSDGIIENKRIEVLRHMIKFPAENILNCLLVMVEAAMNRETGLFIDDITNAIICYGKDTGNTQTIQNELMKKIKQFIMYNAQRKSYISVAKAIMLC
jgi:hypothetical protein